MSLRYQVACLFDKYFAQTSLIGEVLQGCGKTSRDKQNRTGIKLISRASCQSDKNSC